MKASQHFGRHGFDHDKIAAVLSSGKKEEVLPVLRALISAGKATIGSLQVVDRIGRLLRDRDPDVASTAAELLIAADAAGRYEEALILMLQRREDACVMAALSAFSKLGSKISPSRKDLVVHHIATCLSGSRQVHCRALRTLGELRATRQALDIQNRLENQKALFRTKPAEEVRQLQDGAQEQEVAKLREQMMHLASHCSELAKARGDASRLAEGLKEVQEALAESERSADQQDKPEVTKLREQMMHLTSDLAKATGDASRLAEELKEAQQALAESERSADQQAQQFLQKEWCWKNETAKLEEAESFAEAAAQEKDVLRMELAEKVRQLQERAQEEQEVAKLREQMMHLASHCSDLAGNASRSAADLKEAQEALAESERSADQQAQQFLQKEWCWKNETAKLEKAEEFAEAAAQEKVVLRTELAEKVRQLQEAQGKREVTKLREQMTHLTSDAPHMAELAEAAAQEKAVLRTELAEKVRQLQEAQAQQFLQKEWCWKNETAKLEEAESFAEAAAQEKAMLRTELAEKEERLQKAAQELPEAQQVFAQSEAAQRLAEAAAKEKERAPSEKAKEGSDSSTADMERGPWDSPRTLDSCTSEGSPKEVGPGGSFHSAGGKQPAAPAASDGLTPSSTKQVNDVSDLASLSTLSTSPPAMNKDLHQVSLGQDGGEARVVVSCPEAHYDKVQKICMELDIVQAFGRKGDYVDDLDGDEWFGKWQSRVVASATTALQTRKCKNAELFCIAGGKHCHKEVGNQPMLIEAIEKAMKESKLPAVKIRFSWMKVEQFEEHIRRLVAEIQKDAKLRKRKLLDLLEEDPQAAELFAKLTDYVELDEKSKRLVIIGDTGAGKSTFCGLLDGSLQKLKKGVDDKGMPLWEWESNFKLGHKASSETDQPQLRKCYAFGQDGEDPVPLLLMDTPGLEDSRGKKKDDDHMAEVAKWVNGLRYIHGIVILLKNDTRISRGLRNNLEFFQSIFGTDMWVHATVVVNRWPQDSRSRKKRAEGGLQSTAQFEEEFRGVLQKPRPKDATGDDCGVGLAEDKARRLPFYFVDTLYDRGEEDEKSSMRNELDNIRRWALSLQEWFVQATTQSPELKNLIHVVESTNQAADLETALEKALGVDPRPADVTRKKVEAVRKEIEVRSTADRVDEAEKALHKFEETGNREDAQTFVQKFGALNSKQAAAVSSTKMSRLNPAFEVLEKALEGKKSETETATLEVSPQFHQHAQRLIKERNEALTQLDEAVRESSTEKVVRALAKCDSLRLTDPSIPKAKTWLEETQSALGQLENAHKQKSMEAVKQALALCESLNLPADKLQIARTWLKPVQVLDTAVEQAESIKKVREALLFCESVGVPPDDLRKAHHWLEDEQKVQRLIEEFDEKYGLGLSKEFDSFTKAVKLWVREHGVTGTLGHMETRFERLKQIVNEFPKMTEVSKIKVCTLIKSTKLNPQSTRKEWQDVLDPAREHGMNGLQLQKLQTDYDNRLFFHGDIVTMETNRWDDHYVYVSDDHNYVFARKRSTLEGYELTKASWRLHIDGDLHKFESMKCSGRYLCAMDHETNKLWVGISKGSIEEDRCRWKLEPDGSYYGLWNERGDFTHALTFHNHEPGFGRPYCARIPRIGGWEKVYIRRV
ncbi:unnamed protein product [Durusdinium trenchii]|uniref:G domain-containing protein n=1 Tax=Durusdinium trenchii TaxID=1381693 RepID=A0ABP0Q868_9DINO